MDCDKERQEFETSMVLEQANSTDERDIPVYGWFGRERRVDMFTQACLHLVYLQYVRCCRQQGPLRRGSIMFLCQVCLPSARCGL